MHSSKAKSLFLAASVLLTLTACSGGSTESTSADETQLSDDDNPSRPTGSDTTPDLLGDIPGGNITQYGAITVGDDAGMASDLVAAFFELDEGISADFLASAFSSSTSLCNVDDDDTLDFEEISAGFIPSFNGVSKRAVSAGDSVILTSAEGTFANMTSQSGGGFLFYTLSNMQMLPTGTVPDPLQVDVVGDIFPAYQSALMPTVEPIVSVAYTGGSTITPSSVFTWQASSKAGSMVRIFSSTAGGFFLEDGKTVTCLVPDTGSFSFPTTIRNRLGADFIGAPPIFSRVTVRTESKQNSTLILIRETFTE